MFTVNEDLSIYVTRGDACTFPITAEDVGVGSVFPAGTVLRIKVVEKKKCENVVLQKDFPAWNETPTINIVLTENDTRIGKVISKPKDYWYEIEMNPNDNPKTIIGYDEEGPRVFKLFPEGNEIPDEPTDPEDIPVVDSELDLTSTRPVENHAIAKAVANLRAELKKTKETVTENNDDLTDAVADNNAAIAAERARIDNLVVPDSSTGDAELRDIRVGADGQTYASAGTAVRQQIEKLSEKISVTIGKNLYNPAEDVNGYLTPTGSITVLSDWKTTGFIDVSGLESVIVSNDHMNDGYRDSYNFLFLCTYNAQKILIAQVYTTGQETYTIEDGVHYIRFCYHANEVYDLQVESGTRRTLYEPYEEKQEFTNNKTYARENNMLSGMESVRAALCEGIQPFEVIGKTTLEHGLEDAYIISGQDDDYFGYPMLVESGDAVFKISTKITVEPFKSYLITASAVFNHIMYAVYDANDKLLMYEADATGLREGTVIQSKMVVMPHNASYVLISQYDTCGVVSCVERIDKFTCGVKPYHGKKWVCMGDSLTEKNLRSDKNYHDYISEKTGITVVNMGRSGSGYKRTEDEGFAFYQRISDVATDADVVTIFGSGNDLKFADSLGLPADTGTDTICGCINTTIDNLYAVLPTVQLGIISPTPWIYNQPSDNGTMCAYADALKSICQLRGIPFLDLFRCSGLRPNDATYRALVYSKDEGNGVHPNELGHKIIASHVKAFIDSLIL